MPTQSSDVMPPPAAPNAKLVLGKTDDRGVDPLVLLSIARSLGLPDEYAADLGHTIVPVVIVKNLPDGASDPTISGSNYDIFTVDLTGARAESDFGQVPNGLADKVIGSVQVMAITGTAKLHLGNRAGITLSAALQGYKLHPPEQLRLGISNAAQPGASVTLMVSFGAGMSA